MQKIYYIPTKENVISLTFDDGPEPITTPIILDILKNYNIKATFFVLIDNIVTYPKIFERLIQEGHSVGLHSWNHRSWRRHSQSKLNVNIKRCMDILRTSFGVVPKYYRPPYGSFTNSSEIITNELNLTPVGWSASIKDYRGGWPLNKSNDLISQCSNGKIVLLHDGCHTWKHDGPTVKILNNILPLLTQKYSFVSIDELIKNKSTQYLSFNNVPLFHHEIINIQNKTYLMLYWDINCITKQFNLQINNKNILLDYPEINAMKTWPQRIELPLNCNKEIFIENVKLI